MEKIKHNDIKFIFKNIGAIEYAEVPLNDLTMIVGKNSTSKTYLTYIIWGFLDFIYEDNSLPTDLIRSIMFNGNALKQEVDLKDIESNLISTFILLSEALYTKQRVYEVLAIDDIKRLEKFQFNVKVDNLELNHNIKVDDFDVNQVKVVPSIGNGILSFSLIKPSDYQVNDNDLQLIASNLLMRVLRPFIKQIFPRPFIITSERTGIGIFRKEVDGYRSSFAESLARDSTTKKYNMLDKNVLNNIVDRAINSIARYPQPISDNISVSRDLFDITTKTDFAIPAKKYIKDNLTHGEFVFNKSLNEVFYNQIIGSAKVSLPYYLASSSVKSHLLLDSYINYIAQTGQILIIDEPELNLHPDNLRHMARLLAMLVNNGVKLLFTTHSDYIIKELNNLIMLESLPEDARNYAIKQIKKETKTAYQPEMFLAKDKLTCVIAKQDEKLGRVKTEIAPINEFGIDVDIIDREINDIGETSDILSELVNVNHRSIGE
ncbi:MAG: AAA family ATPase [Burkholderiales bacterium]|nr:AAA family ATPase [Burkholderiales bacterium]